MSHHYWSVFLELLRSSFKEVELIWGIVPLYFGLLLNEMTSAKANFRTAVQTGFSFIWAGAHWLYLFIQSHSAKALHLKFGTIPPVNLVVTFLVLLLGIVALVSGMRRRYPKYGAFLGHTRFANYFMITIFPIQAHFQGMDWTWDRLLAIVIFAVPVWLVLHFSLMPVRK